MSNVLKHIKLVSTTCYTFGWDKCNMCLIYMNFLKNRYFIAFCTVTKYAGETCKTDMSLYLEGMVDVLVPTCTEIQIEC